MKYSYLSLCLVLWFGRSADSQETIKPGPASPNVLLIVSDDQRPDTIASLGNRHIRTPHLDRLARRGSVFNRAVCAYPICTPSRAELLSGCTAFRNGVTNFGRKLDTSLVLWPQAMQQAGYRNIYSGKWHNDGTPTTRGYKMTRGLFTGGGRKHWTPAVDYRGQTVTGYVGWIFRDEDGKMLPSMGVGLTADTSRHIADAAIASLEQQGNQPFFLHVNFTAPHDPLVLPTDARHYYKPSSLPLPPNFATEHPFEHGNLRGRDETLLPFPRTPALVLADLAAYYGVISDLDAQIGRILQSLDRLKLTESTLVVFTSDHGLAVGSHGLRGKQSMYEHTIGVPMIFAGPGIPRNQSFQQQVYLRDLYPTVCELCQVPLPHDLDGRSFAPVFANPAAKTYPYTVGYFREFQRMIRTDRWKLIEYPQLSKHQLFDLRADPFERHDLSEHPDHAVTRTKLEAQLRSWQRIHKDPLITEG